MSPATALSRFDHAIVLMTEKRSFDAPPEHPPRRGEGAARGPGSVLTELARGFAVCARWDCAVPHQTLSNRACFHTGSTGERATDAPVAKWLRNDHDTLFNRLEARGLTWAVYYDEGDVFPLSLLIHFPRLWPYFKTNFHALDHFYHDAANGTLPSYALIEPSLFRGGDDEHLIDSIYAAVRGSQTANGSNFSNTLLAIFHAFRSPTAPLMVSGWTSPGHVIRSPLRHTSMLKTLELKWGLEPLTQRDAAAPDFLEVFDRPVLRDLAEWPVLTPPEQALATQSLSTSDHPLDPLQEAIVTAAHAIDTGVRSSLPTSLTVGAAVAHLRGKMAELQVL